MTLTERLERLAPGEPIELVWNTKPGIRIEHGRFERVAPDAFGDQAIFYRHAGASHDVCIKALRYVEPVDPAAIARSYRVDERVIVCRHGRQYRGVVVKVARVQLTVRIVLWAGTSRERQRNVLVHVLDVRRAQDRG